MFDLILLLDNLTITFLLTLARNTKHLFLTLKANLKTLIKSSNVHVYTETLDYPQCSIFFFIENITYKCLLTKFEIANEN